jgi:hypothetical protein
VILCNIFFIFLQSIFIFPYFISIVERKLLGFFIAEISDLSV